MWGAAAAAAALQCLLPRWQRTQEQHRIRAKQSKTPPKAAQQGRPDKATEPRGGNNNIEQRQNNTNHQKPEERKKGKEEKRRKKSITYTGKGGIAYEKVKEEKTRNPSWVHELWDEVLL